MPCRFIASNTSRTRLGCLPCLQALIKALQKAGCFAIVLEKIPADLASEVSQELEIPIIGIGAGNGVDGQVLVLHDMLGMTHEFNPRFLRRYLNLYEDINQKEKNNF